MYLVIAIGALAAVLLLLVLTKRAKLPGRLTPLGGLTFGFVVAGIVFGENRVLGYWLIGTGVVLGLIDIARSLIKRGS